MMELDGNVVRIWPDTLRSELCPTVFLEPTDTRNDAAIGFDLASEAALQDAMVTARDTGQPRATARLRDLPVWEKGWRGNVVLFIPVYQSDARVTTAHAGPRALLGYVFSPLDSARLVQDILGSTRPSVAFDVHDGTVSEQNLLGRSTAVAVAPRHASTQSVHVAGREWLLSARSADEPVGLVSQTAVQTLAAGIALAFLVLWVTRAQVRAWETAARHEAELRASEQALRASESQARAAESREGRVSRHALARTAHAAERGPRMDQHAASRHAQREDRAARALEIIERNAQHQAELIGDLLDVSRIVTGKLRLELRPVALAPIVSTAVESLRPTAQVKGITVSCAPFPDESTIRGDPDRLHQIAWNLISNAIKFTPPDGHVWVELTRDEHHVTLYGSRHRHRDQPEFLPHVFERFRQADSSTTRAHSGVGLGLAIARDLVELHAGTIEVRSEGRDRGATFVVQFPTVTVSAATTAPLVTHAPRPAPRLDGVHVLVVDDDLSTRELLTEALGTTGARVTAADSAPHALEQLSTAGVDVIVSDIAMPGEDGFWLMERIRALPGELGRTPAIALTALARREDRARAIAAGYQMHFAKPVELGELQAGVATLVAHPAADASPET